MEAKIDIRKLQLLNDRICQTIDALNQVRLSVHGLQHTTGMVPGVPQQFGYGNVGYGYGQPQWTGYGYNYAAQAPVPFAVPGLSHTNAQNPLGFAPNQVPWLNTQLNAPVAPWQIPFGVPGLSHTNMQNPLGFAPNQVPWLNTQLNAPVAPWQIPFGGLSHTSPETFVDPYWAIRCAQTFPYAQASYPVVNAF